MEAWERPAPVHPRLRWAGNLRLRSQEAEEREGLAQGQDCVPETGLEASQGAV